MRKVSDLLKSLASFGLCASLGLYGSCGGGGQQMTPPEEMMMTPAPQEPAQPEMGFNHDGTLTLDLDPFKDGLNVSKEESERTHSCGKISYRTLGNILSRRGLTVAGAGTQCNDGQPFDCQVRDLYRNGNLVLGMANYPARAPESDRSTTGGLVKMNDILIAAAEELITAGNPTGAFGATTDCATTALYDGQNKCLADGFACFVGVPLTQGQLDQCSASVAGMIGSGVPALDAKRLTAAALASTIYLCD